MASNTGFGNAVIDNPEVAFRQSFGWDMASGECYSDPMGYKSTGEIEVTDLGKKLNDSHKAMSTTTGGAGTAGYALVPVYVDPRIVDTTRKQTPLVALTPRVANMGTTFDYNQITAKGAAVWEAEDAALTESTDTYDRVSKAIKYAYSVGRVTGPAQAAVPGYTIGAYQPQTASNAKQQRVITATIALRELEEEAIVNGDGTDNDPEGFVAQISTTNKVDKSTTAISLDDIDTAIQYAVDDGGLPNLLVCDTATYKDIKGLITDSFRVTPTQKLSWGYEALSYNSMAGPMPVLWSRFLTNASGSKSIYALDMNEIEMRVLQDVTYQELAQVNDSQKFLLKAYETYAVKAPAFNGWVGGIL